MKYVDIKYTVWERTYLDEDIDNENLIEQIKNRDIFDMYDSEILFETMEGISLNDNDGEATIEFYDDEQEDSLIWTNEEN